jgi:PEP-CTERM motif
MKFSHIAAAAALSLAASASMAGVFPNSTGTCSLTDVSIGSFSATDCRGFFDGNLNSNSDYTGGVKTYLQTEFGVTLGASIIEQIATGTDANFTGDLGGDVVVGIHWGGGQGGGETAFYFFDDLAFTTANVNPVDVNPTRDGGALSNVALYLNTDPIAGPIPEPSTYALMLAGLGAVGLVARRRRVQK